MTPLHKESLLDALKEAMSPDPGTTLSPRYLAAIRAHDVACAIYRASAALYRRREIGDFEFAVALGAKRAADAAFDAAYDAEAKSSEGAVLS